MHVGHRRAAVARLRLAQAMAAITGRYLLRLLLGEGAPFPTTGGAGGAPRPRFRFS
jgi:hypothetical protein